MGIFFTDRKDIDLRPEDLFNEYYPRLCDFASRYLKDDGEGEDAVQDAFIVYIEQRDSISQHPSAIKSFLYNTVKNICLNKIRHQKVESRYNEGFFLDTQDENHMLEAIVHAEVIGEIHQALNSLPKGCHLVLKLGYLDGLKNAQIAEELGISLNTVKSQKQRALMLLRQKLVPQAMTLLLSFLIF